MNLCTPMRTYAAPPKRRNTPEKEERLENTSDFLKTTGNFYAKADSFFFDLKNLAKKKSDVKDLKKIDWETLQAKLEYILNSTLIAGNSKNSPSQQQENEDEINQILLIAPLDSSAKNITVAKQLCLSFGLLLCTEKAVRVFNSKKCLENITQMRCKSVQTTISYLCFCLSALTHEKSPVALSSPKLFADISRNARNDVLEEFEKYISDLLKTTEEIDKIFFDSVEENDFLPEDSRVLQNFFDLMLEYHEIDFKLQVMFSKLRYYRQRIDKILKQDRFSLLVFEETEKFVSMHHLKSKLEISEFENRGKAMNMKNNADNADVRYLCDQILKAVSNSIVQVQTFLSSHIFDETTGNPVTETWFDELCEKVLDAKDVMKDWLIDLSDEILSILKEKKPTPFQKRTDVKQEKAVFKQEKPVVKQETSPPVLRTPKPPPPNDSQDKALLILKNFEENMQEDKKNLLNLMESQKNLFTKIAEREAKLEETKKMLLNQTVVKTEQKKPETSNFFERKDQFKRKIAEINIIDDGPDTKREQEDSQKSKKRRIFLPETAKSKIVQNLDHFETKKDKPPTIFEEDGDINFDIMSSSHFHDTSDEESDDDSK